MTFVLPFDFEYWFITFIAGNLSIFFILFAALVASLGALLRLPNVILLAAFALASFMLGEVLPELKILTIFIGGLFIFWSIVKVTTR